MSDFDPLTVLIVSDDQVEAARARSDALRLRMKRYPRPAVTGVRRARKEVWQRRAEHCEQRWVYWKDRCQMREAEIEFLKRRLALKETTTSEGGS